MPVSEQKISLYEMLEKSGDVADAGQDSRGCEFFYSLLNEIDTVPSIVNSAGFMKKTFIQLLEMNIFNVGMEEF